MLIGGSDISNYVIPLIGSIRVASMFAYIWTRFRLALIGGNLRVQ